MTPEPDPAGTIQAIVIIGIYAFFGGVVGLFLAARLAWLRWRRRRRHVALPANTDRFIAEARYKEPQL